MSLLLAAAALLTPTALAGATLSYDGQPLVEYADAQVVDEVWLLGEGELVGEWPSDKTLPGACVLASAELSAAVEGDGLHWLAPYNAVEVDFVSGSRACGAMGGVYMGDVLVLSSEDFELEADSLEGDEDPPPKFLFGTTVYMAPVFEDGGGLAICEVLSGHI